MARQSYNSRIRSRIAELEQEIVARQTELDELKIAERVIDRLGSDEPERDDNRDDNIDVRDLTIAKLIILVHSGHGAMESSGVHQRMANEYYRNTTLNTVVSTLSRLKSEGRVTLNGRLWSVRKEPNFLQNEAPTRELEGAS
jgi:hypothetical protein